MGGDDRSLFRLNPYNCNVSIHAPAWGATKMAISYEDIRSFNPRPRMGGDAVSCVDLASGEFQSTPPHGGRRGLVLLVGPVGVSIHAPAWGATH